MELTARYRETLQRRVERWRPTLSDRWSAPAPPVRRAVLLGVVGACYALAVVGVSVLATVVTVGVFQFRWLPGLLGVVLAPVLAPVAVRWALRRVLGAVGD